MNETAILLVGSDCDLRYAIRSTLSHEGFSVVDMPDGSEALSYLNVQRQKVALLIADLVMPKMGGRELLWRSNELFPDLPVVLLSGMLNEELAYTGIDVRADRFLEMPISCDELVRVVKSVWSDVPSTGFNNRSETNNTVGLGLLVPQKASRDESGIDHVAGNRRAC